jgi:hypothetical protein
MLPLNHHASTLHMPRVLRLPASSPDVHPPQPFQQPSHHQSPFAPIGSIGGIMPLLYAASI